MQAGLYKHYKGGYYQVLGIAEHTETHETVVVYISLDVTKDGPRMRVRPFSGPEGFDTLVRIQDPSGDDSGNIPRFQYIGNGFN